MILNDILLFLTYFIVYFINSIQSYIKYVLIDFLYYQ